jgi:hypothetical protein
MSRFITAGRTCNFPNASTTKDASKAEGLAFALDGLSIVMSTASAGPCNSGAADCNAATDPNSGLASTRAVTHSGGTYTFTNWTDVLRVVYGGLLFAAGNNITTRDCNSSVRQAVVGSWNNLFQVDCAGTTCTQLAHAFRRDDESGTTDVFLAVLNLPSLNLQTGVSTFCNVIQPVSAGPNRPPYFPEFQDNDPVRRPCVGTGNLPVTPGGEPPSAPTEQVCSKDGTLGVVIPINPPPVRATQAPLPYPLNYCARGRFNLGRAPRISASASDRCPNGDIPVLGNQCLVPVDVNDSRQCINGRNNLPPLRLDPVGANAVDGRVYNLHTRKADGTYQTIRRPGTAAGTVVEAELVGSFYRIHATRTALAAPSTTGICREPDATLQLGCVAQANPCSMAYAGREATTIAGTIAAKLAALEPTTDCVRNLITGAGAPYPFSRKLYLNSMVGFESVTGQELALAGCFANEALVNPIVSANGFITLGQDVFCEDFPENTCPGQTSTNNACTGNPF